jgi:hypothetical protein
MRAKRNSEQKNRSTRVAAIFNSPKDWGINFCRDLSYLEFIFVHFVAKYFFISNAGCSEN